MREPGERWELVIVGRLEEVDLRTVDFCEELLSDTRMKITFHELESALRVTTAGSAM